MMSRDKKKNGCLTLIIGIIVFFGVIGATLIGSGILNAGIQKSVSGISNSDEYITLDEYNSIKTDMTYDEVTKIVGSNGTESSAVSMNGITMSIYTWYGNGTAGSNGNGTAGSNANVTFTNGKVTGKAQVGLK